MKSIPLAVPMGGDATCCIHGDTCKEIASRRKFVFASENIHFRCPLLVEVDYDIEYPEWYESCFVNMNEGAD